MAQAVRNTEGLIPFKPGQSGNPAGRPRGARSKLTELTLQRLFDDFETHGVEAIVEVRTKSPSTYLQCIVSLLPKQAEKISSPMSELSDEELEQLEHWLKAKQIDATAVDVTPANPLAPEDIT